MKALKILVVESNPTQQLIYAHLCARFGYKASFCASTAAAADALSVEPYDIVIMEYIFPKKNGIELIKFIRNLDQQSKTPTRVVAVSEEFNQDDSAELHSADVEFIKRPFTMEQFRELMAKA